MKKDRITLKPDELIVEKLKGVLHASIAVLIAVLIGASIEVLHWSTMYILLK